MTAVQVALPAVKQGRPTQLSTALTGQSLQEQFLFQLALKRDGLSYIHVSLVSQSYKVTAQSSHL